MTDWKLVREYVDKGSQQAFAELVRRHMNLVYWTCRRHLGNASQAEDATQEVFILLARKAGALSPRESLAGWLFLTSRLVCRGESRSTSRRRRLEEEAARQLTTVSNETRPEIEPLIDDALAALSEADREAILMRFVDDLTLAELAGRIGTSEDAARKRVARAVEKLRGHLSRRNAAISTVILVSLLEEVLSKEAPPSVHPLVEHAVNNLPATGVVVRAVAKASRISAKSIVASTVAALVVVAGASIWVKQSRANRLPTPAEMVSDRSAAGMPASVGTPADRQSLLSMLKQASVGMRDGNASWVTTLMTPNARIVTKYRGSFTPASFSQSEAGFYAALQIRRPHMTLAGYDIHGNHGTARVQAHMDAVMGGAPASPWARLLGSPSGPKLAADDTWSFDLERINGRWYIAGGHELSYSRTEDGKPF